ncbi:hypothetical protein G6O67_006748 [Ophiocordyceps sinensis]|uniref:Uncharacterized protein n=1 Tax=Ophiocordyceps sinensis TaxID=72228 RepID=A0A8H4PL34_9HYPO|nr:hypothetical protein G6O67_006748 [Ophiocordyceps sinensis]
MTQRYCFTRSRCQAAISSCGNSPCLLAPDDKGQRKEVDDEARNRHDDKHGLDAHAPAPRAKAKGANHAQRVAEKGNGHKRERHHLVQVSKLAPMSRGREAYVWIGVDDARQDHVAEGPESKRRHGASDAGIDPMHALRRVSESASFGVSTWTYTTRRDSEHGQAARHDHGRQRHHVQAHLGLIQSLVPSGQPHNEPINQISAVEDAEARPDEGCELQQPQLPGVEAVRRCREDDGLHGAQDDDQGKARPVDEGGGEDVRHPPHVDGVPHGPPDRLVGRGEELETHVSRPAHPFRRRSHRLPPCRIDAVPGLEPGTAPSALFGRIALGPGDKLGLLKRGCKEQGHDRHDGREGHVRRPPSGLGRLRTGSDGAERGAELESSQVDGIGTAPLVDEEHVTDLDDTVRRAIPSGPGKRTLIWTAVSLTAAAMPLKMLLRNSSGTVFM